MEPNLIQKLEAIIRWFSTFMDPLIFEKQACADIHGRWVADRSWKFTDPEIRTIENTYKMLSMLKFVATEAPQKDWKQRLDDISDEMAMKIKSVNPKLTQKQMAAICGLSCHTVNKLQTANRYNFTPNSREEIFAMWARHKAGLDVPAKKTKAKAPPQLQAPMMDIKKFAAALLDLARKRKGELTAQAINNAKANTAIEASYSDNVTRLLEEYGLPTIQPKLLPFSEADHLGMENKR